MIVLKATQEKLLSVLQSVAGIVEKRHTLPILANVLLRKTAGNVQFTTSDLEIQIRTTADMDGDAGNFTTTVGARKLIDILRTMPSDQTVSLESSQNKLILKGGKSRFTLQTLPAEDFPLVQEAPSFGPVQRAAEDAEGPAEPGQLRDGGARHPLLPERHPVRGRRQAAVAGGHRRPPPGLCQRHARRRSAAPGSDPAAQDRAGTAAPAVRCRRRHRDAVRQQPGQVRVRRHGVRHQAGRGQVPRLQPRDPQEPQEQP
jgi:hypothetical protein